MRGAIPPILQHAFMALCSVKTQGQLYLYLNIYHSTHRVNVKWKGYCPHLTFPKHLTNLHDLLYEEI